jgi:hypothetical protein
VKKDVKRFPRVHMSNAAAVTVTQELFSPFNPKVWKAEDKAFAALMADLKEFNSHYGTLLIVQVENETGLLGDSRDLSRITEELFKAPVPTDLITHLQSNFSSESE